MFVTRSTHRRFFVAGRLVVSLWSDIVVVRRFRVAGSGEVLISSKEGGQEDKLLAVAAEHGVDCAFVTRCFPVVNEMERK